VGKCFSVESSVYIRALFCRSPGFEGLHEWWVWSIGGVILTVQNLSTRRKTSQCHFIHRKYHVDWAGVDAASARWGGDDCLTHDMALTTRIRLKLIYTIYKRSSSYFTENPFFISCRLVLYWGKKSVFIVSYEHINTLQVKGTVI